MEGVLVEDESVSSKAVMDDSNIVKYTVWAFEMYGDPVANATIELEDS